MTKQTKWPMCRAKTQIIWISAKSDQSLLPAWRNYLSMASHRAHSEDWSDWVNAQVDLSLRWAHKSFCVFSQLAANFKRMEPYDSKMGRKCTNIILTEKILYFHKDTSKLYLKPLETQLLLFLFFFFICIICNICHFQPTWLLCEAGFAEADLRCSFLLKTLVKNGTVFKFPF